MDSKITVKNIGEGVWDDTWVSKSDIIEYLRCPYRIYLSHKEKIPMESLKKLEIISAFLDKGNDFEDSIISQHQFKEAERIEDVLKEEVILRAPILIQNNELGLRGIVDLIDIRKGKLYPIEIKDHKYLRDTDKLELAFYWELLEPMRIKKSQAKGYVLLNTGETVEVQLTEDEFAKLEYVIGKVRDVKKNGCLRCICDECKSCVLEETCKSSIIKSGNVSMISGVGSIRFEQLRNMGVSDIATFAEYDTVKLWQTWSDHYGPSPGLVEISKMQIHAMSWLQRKPLKIGSEPFPITDNFIILDLEYMPAELVYLVGLIVVSKNKTQYHQFFANQYRDEITVIHDLLGIINNTTSKVVTWFGNNADIPQLESAFQRCDVPRIELARLIGKHIDIGLYMKRNHRLPIISSGLSEVETYFGYKRKNKWMSGLWAIRLYEEYMFADSEAKERKIRTQLLNYNKEDLDATLLIVNRLKELSEI